MENYIEYQEKHFGDKKYLKELKGNYKTFNKEISEMISRVSKDITFVGDYPKSANTKVSDERMTLRTMKVELNEAIKEEDYEEAARLRDEIKKLEKKIKNDNS